MFEIEKNQKNMPEMNGYLLSVTQKINIYHQIAKNSILGISLILAHIAEYPKVYFENSGFSTIAEYAESMFSYKKAYTYKLIKIAKFISIKSIEGNDISIKDFIEDKITVDYKFKTIEDSDGFEYSTSQMLELIPLTQQQIKDNMKSLDSSLSCKELREIVKEIINPPIETTATEIVSRGEQKDDSEIIELSDKERIIKMLEICSTLENVGIKERIINIFQKSLKELEKK